jgi:hypothetical protein
VKFEVVIHQWLEQGVFGGEAVNQFIAELFDGIDEVVEKVIHESSPEWLRKG